MEITLGKYNLENDVDCKCISDGWEIFSSAVERENIKPADFQNADWGMYGSIIVSEV
jgi:hypothetical protein